MQVGKYGRVTGFKAYIRTGNSRKSVAFQLWKPEIWSTTTMNWLLSTHSLPM